MAKFEDGKVSFEIPAGWEDRSIISFAMKADPKRPFTPNVVMTRDSGEPNDTLSSYANRQLTGLAKKLDGMNLIDRIESTIGGRNAITIHFTWKGTVGEIEQRLVIVKTGRVFTQFTTTCAQEDARATAPAFERVIASVVFAGIEGVHS